MNQKNLILKMLFILPITVTVIYVSYYNLPFMESKIEEHWDSQVSKDEVTWGRFGVTMYNTYRTRVLYLRQVLLKGVFTQEIKKGEKTWVRY